MVCYGISGVVNLRFLLGMEKIRKDSHQSQPHLMWYNYITRDLSRELSRE